MIEIFGWTIMVGLAVVIAGIYMLSNQLEKHMRELTAIMIHGNDMIVAHLKRLADPSHAVPEPAVGVILERRCAQRRNRSTSTGTWLGRPDQRKSPGRRLQDLLEPGEVGYFLQ